MMSQSPSISLSAVQASFAQWRAQRRGPARTPEALRVQAVSLIGVHSRTEIARTLGITSQMLKQWQSQYGAARLPSAAAFIELPGESQAVVSNAVVLPTMTLTRHQGDGSAWSVAGELSPGQWQEALKLLASGVQP
jgi:hypothetical protein